MAGGEATATEAGERYASALFDLARESDAIDAASGDLATLKAMLAESEDLTRLAESPAFSADDKQAALVAVAEKAGLSNLVRDFLGVLARNRRAFELVGVIAAFERLAAAYRGVTTAEVVSAQPLSDAQTRALADALKAAADGEVELSATVDPAILGGLVVRVGSRMFDSSLKTKLAGLKTAMKGT